MNNLCFRQGTIKTPEVEKYAHSKICIKTKEYFCPPPSVYPSSKPRCLLKCHILTDFNLGPFAEL